MKSKAPLALIELAIMLLVFALAAVLCLRAFVWAETASKENLERDQALVQAQSAAEVLKACTGDPDAAMELYGGGKEGQTWTVWYDEAWNQTAQAARYRLVAVPVQTGLAYLGMANIQVFREETCLAQLDVAWQEVTACE